MSRAERIRRPLVVVAVMAALAALFFALGRWQLQRAEESTERLERFAATASEPELRVADDRSIDTLRYRRLRLRGSFEPRLQFLLDNAVHAGEVGYQVLTPFRPVDGDRWLLVNRGWLKADPDRRVLPDVRVAAGERTIAGRIDTLPRPGLALAAPALERGHEGVLVVSYPSTADLAAALGQAVLGYQLLLDATERDGYRRDWSAPGMAPERHFAYAGQWLLLALGAAAVAIVTGARMVRARSQS